MVDPLFWLSLSALMLAASLAVLVAIAVPTMHELNRTARSAEKLFDTLNRELPSTLDALRSTTRELTDLTENLGDGVASTKQIIQQVDRSLGETGYQLYQARITSQSAIAGVKAAWNAFFRSNNDDAPSAPAHHDQSAPPTDFIPRDTMKRAIAEDAEDPLTDNPKFSEKP